MAYELEGRPFSMRRQPAPLCERTVAGSFLWRALIRRVCHGSITAIPIAELWTCRELMPGLLHALEVAEEAAILTARPTIQNDDSHIDDRIHHPPLQSRVRCQHCVCGREQNACLCCHRSSPSTDVLVPVECRPLWKWDGDTTGKNWKRWSRMISRTETVRTETLAFPALLAELFREWVNTLRGAEARWPRTTLARKGGMSVKTIDNWLQGKVVPKPQGLSAITAVLRNSGCNEKLLPRSCAIWPWACFSCGGARPSAPARAM